MLGLAVRVACVHVSHRKTRGRTLVSPSGYSPEPRSSTALGHAWGRVKVRVRARVRVRGRVRGGGRGRGRVRVRVS